MSEDDSKSLYMYINSSNADAVLIRCYGTKGHRHVIQPMLEMTDAETTSWEVDFTLYSRPQ